MVTKPFKQIKKIISKNGNNIAKQIFLQSYSLEDLFPNAEKLYPIKPETVATPEVKQINFVKYCEAIHSDNYSLPAIYTAHLSQVIYYPKYDLVFTDSGKIIEETKFIYNLKPNQIGDFIKTVNLKVAHLFPFVSQPKKISGICSVIRQFGRQKNHGHTLVDVTPRLYLLNQPEYKNIDEIKLLFSSEPTAVEHFMISKLAPKNVKITVIENPNSLYLVDQLIFPTCLTRPAAAYLPSEYIEYFRDRVLPKRESKKIHRIFISRAKSSSRRMINEDELFEALKPYGFKKYSLEGMSIEDEIELFYDADYVVGTNGAGMANMIFSPQLKVLEIFANEYFQTHYYYLAKSLGHTYRYCHGYNVGAGGEKKPMRKDDIWSLRRADFKVNVSEVVEGLLELEKQDQY